MLDRLRITNDHESDCVRYELADKDGIVTEVGSIPQNEFFSIRNRIINDLADVGDTKVDVLDYISVLFCILD